MLCRNESWLNTIINLYESIGASFFREFRGSFSGVLYDKVKKEWIVFSDQIGTKPIYYAKRDRFIVISTEYLWIVDFLKCNSCSLSLNPESVYMLLTYGFMLENHSIIEGINRLLPGHYLSIKNHRISQISYYKPTNKSESMKKESDYIEEMDYYFRNAIKLQFDKDLEYGYKHLVSLSGGLDSRMTSVVAHETGYENQVNLTYAQSDSFDAQIPDKISRGYRHEWIFKSLDNGLFLKDIDDMTLISGGNCMYYGLAHQNSIYKLINFSPYGILHGGNLGDVLFGGSYNNNSNYDEQYSMFDGVYSRNKLSEKLNRRKFLLEYDNRELFLLYNRGFLGANYGNIIINQYTETLSPFCNIDVLSYALSIPLCFRFGHNIYKEWILKKYASAANYKWAKTGGYLAEQTILIMGRKITTRQFLNIIYDKLLSTTGLRGKDTEDKRHMNPFDYWIKTNDELKCFFVDYYKKYINLVRDGELREDLANHFTHGRGIEKIQVLSLLSAIKTFNVSL